MLALDHIVIGNHHIERASKQFSENFSVKSIKGGKHPNWGTYNHLAYLENDCYMEWLGIYDEKVAAKSDNPLIIHLQYVLANDTVGPFQFALRTNHLDSFVEHFKQKDISFLGPVKGRRTTPDGEELKWRMLFPTYDVKETMLPFLIEWEQSTPYNPVNDKQIKVVNYSGLDTEEFCHIYQMNQTDSSNNVILENCQLNFIKDNENFLDFSF